MKKTFALLFMIILSAGLLLGPSGQTRCDDTDYGVEAYRLLRIINDTYPKRVHSASECSPTKTAMLGWIDETMASYGYSVHGNYEGTYPGCSTPIVSHTFVKKGNSNARILIGAHYDCVDTNGCEDNGSGVATVLELAKRFADTPTALTLEFAFWDGEETMGSSGSLSYLDHSPDVSSVMLTINLDSVGAGDYLFVYGGRYVDSVLRQVWGYNMARDVALRQGIDLRQMPIEVEHYESPTRSDASDQVWFYRRGIPYVYFEANAWTNEEGEVPFPDKPYNYNSRRPVFNTTEGRIIHTKFDDMDELEKWIPGIQLNHLREVNTIVSQMIREMTLESPAVYEPIYEGYVHTVNGWVTYNHGAVTGGNPPPTEHPVTEPPFTEPPETEPPATEPPETEPPETDAPSSQPSGSEDETPSENETGEGASTEFPASDTVPSDRPSDPGRETPPREDPAGEDPEEPGKKSKGNALGFWLLEGGILLTIGLLAAFLVLTSDWFRKKMRRKRRRKNALKR